MCISIGSEWGCGCTWRGWFFCPDSETGLCNLSKICRDGLSPPLDLPGEHMTAPKQQWHVIAKKYQTHLKFRACCGPRCCEVNLESIGARSHGQVSHADAARAKRHITQCFPMFCRGLGKLNSMRYDLREASRVDAPLNMTTLANALADSELPPVARLREYQNLFNDPTYGGLQNARDNAKMPYEHYLALRKYVLETPHACPTTWVPAEDLRVEYQRLVAVHGPDSYQAAQVWLERTDLQQSKDHILYVLQARPDQAVVGGAPNASNASLAGPAYPVPALPAPPPPSHPPAANQPASGDEAGRSENTTHGSASPQTLQYGSQDMGFPGAASGSARSQARPMRRGGGMQRGGHHGYNVPNRENSPSSSNPRRTNSSSSVGSDMSRGSTNGRGRDKGRGGNNSAAS